MSREHECLLSTWCGPASVLSDFQPLNLSLPSCRRRRYALECLPVLFFFATPHSLQDLSSLTRDGTLVLAVKALSPNHWTTRELPPSWKFLKSSSRGWDQLGGHYPWSLCLSFSTILGVDQMPQEALTLVLGLMASRMVAQEQGCPTDLHNSSVRRLSRLGVTGSWDPADVG